MCYSFTVARTFLITVFVGIFVSLVLSLSIIVLYIVTCCVISAGLIRSHLVAACLRTLLLLLRPN